MSDYSTILDQIGASLSQPEPEVVTPAPSNYKTQLDEIGASLEKTAGIPAPTTPQEPAAVDYTAMQYSENDLLSDEFYYPIEGYMIDRFGEHIREYDRADVVEKFTNNMRGFAGGNTVRAINEITYLNEVTDDEDRLSRAGQAYSIYENMQGLFGETDTGEKLEVVGDFLRSAVLDPANVLSLGVGKVATSTGFKGGSQLALIAAKKAYQKKLAEGATVKVAQEFGERVFSTQVKAATARTAQTIAQRQAVEQSAKTFIQRVTTPIALREAAAVGTFEAAVSAGTDYLYQDAMLRTKVQDEYSVFQTGLSAVVGLVAGGVSGALSNAGTGRAGLATPQSLKEKVGPAEIQKLFEQAGLEMPADAASPKASNWLRDIAKGKELADQDSEFFITMLLGNDEKGLQGLAHILLEEGYVWRPRNPKDKVSNWIGDIIRATDPQNAKKFLEDFVAATGIEMNEGRQLDLDGFVNTFKKKMSQSGQVLNAASQVAKILGRDPKKVTVDDYLRFVLAGDRPEAEGMSDAVGNVIGKAVNNFVSRDLPDLQNNIIRLMVSNLSTTALNVTGYAASTVANTASDVTRAVLLGGKSGLYIVTNPKQAKEFGISVKGILQNQIQKARNTLDINATYDTFLKYAEARPEAMKELTRVLPGGVESLDKIKEGFDPNTPLLTLKLNQAVDIIQKANLVQAQDGYTKALEFTSQMDKLLRRSKDEGGFGMSWNEFFNNKDHPKLMLSERYSKLEAMAVDETLKSVFSKSYKGRGWFGEAAGFIEDARNIPGIGLLIPFGRFFNNTIAFAYDATAVGPLVSKAMGFSTDKQFSEIFSRGIVTWSLIGMLAQREMQFIDQGLGWSEEIDEVTGEVVDERYEFPYGAYKSIARLVAHHMRGDEVPAGLVQQYTDQFFGQLTRQLGEAGTGLGEIAKALLSDEGPGLAAILGETLGSIPAQGISGITRPLEPINTLVGLSRDEEYYVPDRKQGMKALNNALRYVDQMVAIATGEDLAPPVFSAAEGQPRVQASRLVSTTRGSRLTSTEQIMNSIGRPTYLANAMSQSEVADNRFNEVFNLIVEDKARALYNSESFKKGSLEVKQNLVDKLFTDARKMTKSYLGRLVYNSDDRGLLKLLEISDYSRQLVSRVTKDLGIEKSLDEMSEEELDTLYNALKYRKEFLGVE